MFEPGQEGNRDLLSHKGRPWWHSGKDSKLPMQGNWVRSLVRELYPTCMPQLRVHMLQLRSPPAATKTQCNQINK